MTLTVRNDPFADHKPGPDCARFEAHTHMADGSIRTRLPMDPDPNAQQITQGTWLHWGHYLRGGPGGPSLADETFVATKETLLALIAVARPKAEPDENGDVPCLRLWPVAQCRSTSGHYGGCYTR